MADMATNDLIWKLFYAWEEAMEGVFEMRWSPVERPQFDAMIEAQRAVVIEATGMARHLAAHGFAEESREQAMRTANLPSNTKRDSIWDYDGDGDVDRDDANAWLILAFKTIIPLTIIILLGLIACVSLHHG